jgi:hypothetical protein
MRDENRVRGRWVRPFIFAAGCGMVIVLSSCSTPSANRAAQPTETMSVAQQDAQTFQDEYSAYVSLSLESISKDDLAPLLTGDVLAESLSEIADARARGTRFVGKYRYYGFQVTEHGNDAAGREYMVAQACLDVTGTRILDATGQDTTPARDPTTSMQMKAVRLDDGTWRISDVVRNDEVDACG